MCRRSCRRRMQRRRRQHSPMTFAARQSRLAKAPSCSTRGISSTHRLRRRSPRINSRTGSSSSRSPTCAARQPRVRRSRSRPLVTTCDGLTAMRLRPRSSRVRRQSYPVRTTCRLEDERIRGLVSQLPVFAPGQPVSVVVVPGVSNKVTGFWSLWRVSLQTSTSRQERSPRVFVSDDGRILGPTARIVWDRMIELPPDLIRSADVCVGAIATSAYERSRAAAEAQGAHRCSTSFRGCTQRTYSTRATKGESGFRRRKRVVERVGLPAVRIHRLAALAEEERSWSQALASNAATLPELAAIVLVRVGAPEGST